MRTSSIIWGTALAFLIIFLSSPFLFPERMTLFGLAAVFTAMLAFIQQRREEYSWNQAGKMDGAIRKRKYVRKSKEDSKMVAVGDMVVAKRKHHGRHTNKKNKK